MANNGGDSDESPSPLASMEASPESRCCSVDTKNLTASYDKKESACSSLSPFDLLPDDLVTSVFSHLPAESLCACARACRRFYFLAWEPRLWVRLRLGPSSTLDADAALDRLLALVARHSGAPDLRSAAQVRRLELGGCVRLTDTGLAAAAARCPALRRADLRGCTRVTERGVFSGLVARCPHLQHLDVAGELKAGTSEVLFIRGPWLKRHLTILFVLLLLS